MGNPKISIIIPVYRVEPYLRECLDSVLGQTYRNLEIILVDDGSPDNCGAICDEYAARDKRIRVIHKKNGGLASARNAGLEMASGEWIGWVDSDDAVHSSFVETLYSACVDLKAEISMCGFSTDRGQMGAGSPAPRFYSGYEMNEALSWDGSGAFGVIWNKLYATKLFEGIRFPVGRTHEDEATVYRLLWKAERCAVLERRLYFYRQRPGSIVNSPFSERNMDAARAYRERIRFYEAHGARRLTDYTKAVYCYFLRRHLREIRRDLGDSELWIREMWTACRDVLRSGEVTLKKKLSLALHMISPHIGGFVKEYIYGRSPSDKCNRTGL